jgi:hypothetical protein
MIWSTLSRHSNFVIKHMVDVILKLDEDVMAAIPVLPAWCHDALHVDFLRALLASSESVPHPSYSRTACNGLLLVFDYHKNVISDETAAVEMDCLQQESTCSKFYFCYYEI